MSGHCMSSSPSGVNPSPSEDLRIRFSCGPSVNALYIGLWAAEVATTVEIREGVLADFDRNRELVGIEIPDLVRRNDGELSIPEKMSV